MDSFLPACDSTIYDLLNRQEFVSNVITISEALSQKRKSMCFAIDGRWGAGKSFVLDRIAEQASNTLWDDEYVFAVFRYNCWEYDYYEEPLLSIVATMLKAVSASQQLFSEKTRNTFFEVAKAVGSELLNAAGEKAKEATGIDFLALRDKIVNIKENVQTALQSSEAFNELLPFQKALMVLKEQIRQLAEEKTIIFLVDELDRCLPEYAIRVLERLHHLVEGIENVQIIFSIDRDQLQYTVREIFGENTNVRSYLKKFISFELRLENGKMSGEFDLRFADYFQQFEQAQLPDDPSIALFPYIFGVFNDIEMRDCIAIVEEADLVHKITWKGAPGHPFYLCLELLLAFCKSQAISIKDKADDFEISQVLKFPAVSHKLFGGYSGKGITFVNKMIADASSTVLFERNGKTCINITSLPGFILAGIRRIMGFTHDLYGEMIGPEFVSRDFNVRFIDNYYNFLSLLE